MKHLLLFFLFISILSTLRAQETKAQANNYTNVTDALLQTDGNLMIGGYGEVHYNQSFDAEKSNNGILDVHRMVLFFGYNFSNKTQFVSEIEFEHVSELYVEQAFLQHRINSSINLRGGLLLIPMGIVNEYHEPTAFNGVERPVIDNKISPSTWREIGFGLTGNIQPASLKYQAYLVNGFNGYDGTAKLSGKNALRNGRQKGAESYISSPNFTARTEFYGIKNLNIGLSGYFGNTQSKLYNGIERTNAIAISKADSSVVGITMFGADARYTLKALQIRGQFYSVALSNTEQYNQLTALNGKSNDLGNKMLGYYVEAGYNMFRHHPKAITELIPFVRYEAYDTHFSVDKSTAKNPAYSNQVITTGVSYKLTKGVILKADVQLAKPKNANSFTKSFNSGFGITF